jgi:hypothetical protein
VRWEVAAGAGSGDPHLEVLHRNSPLDDILRVHLLEDALEGIIFSSVIVIVGSIIRICNQTVHQAIKMHAQPVGNDLYSESRKTSKPTCIWRQGTRKAEQDEGDSRSKRVYKSSGLGGHEGTHSSPGTGELDPQRIHRLETLYLSLCTSGVSDQTHARPSWHRMQRVNIPLMLMARGTASSPPCSSPVCRRSSPTVQLCRLTWPGSIACSFPLPA